MGLSGYLALQALAGGSTAVSAPAKTLRDRASNMVAFADRSEALFGDKGQAIAELRKLAADHAEPDWNGEGAAPVDPRAVAMAERFIRALPFGVPMPEFAAEPDGAISLDWIESRYRMLSISVGSGPRLAYAWHDGSARGHAVDPFDGHVVPKRILERIREIANAHLRAA
jgi:hypothetical protein